MGASYVPSIPSDIGAEPANANIQSHIGVTSGNPHGATAAMVGADPSGSAAAVQANLTPISASFQSVLQPGKNLFNPVGATDGKIINYPDGALVTYPPAVSLGKMPVTAGKRYTLSLQGVSPFSLAQVLYCYDGDGNFLGIDHTIGINAGMSAPPTSIVYKSSLQVSFSIPTSSRIGFIAMMTSYVTGHTTQQFLDLIGGVQLEIGDSATAYASYSTTSIIRLSDASAPQSLQSVCDAVSTIGKNLFNPEWSTNGAIINYVNGTIAAYAPGIVLGPMPVSPGLRYTLSVANGLGIQPYIFCYDADKSFLGMSFDPSTGAEMSNPPHIISTGALAITMDIPAVSAIRWIAVTMEYSTHTLDDYYRLIGTVQFELSSTATAYVPYQPGTMSAIKRTSLPAGTITDSTNGGVTLVVDRSTYYVRTRLDAQYDLVQKLAVTGVNACLNFSGAVKVPRETPDSVTVSDFAANISTHTLAYQGDDACPANYNSTYIGANHGPYFALEATCTSAHGKTVVDVGSVWIDANSKQWIIARIKSTTVIWLFPIPTDAGPPWVVSSTFPALPTTITHVTGASHTGAMTVSATVLTQLTPIAQSGILAVMIDGKPITADGIYGGNGVDLIHHYNIPNVASIVDFLRAHVGSSSQPQFNDPSITSDVQFRITYHFAASGACTTYHRAHFINQVSLYYIGFIQAAAINNGTDHLWQYIPDVSTTNGYDFAATVDISSGVTSTLFPASSWVDANKPPSRMAQIVKTSGGTSQFGFTLGYCPTRGIGVPATRKNLIGSTNQALWLYSSKKMYPSGANGSSTTFSGNVPAGTVLDCVAFRSFYNCSDVPEATVNTWYEDGTDVIYMLDFHQSVTNKLIPMPTKFLGKTISVIDAHANFSLLSSFVGMDGIIVTVTNNYGYGILRIA